MPNHKSSIKRARQTIKRNDKNRARRSSVRALTKDVQNIVATGDLTKAPDALRVAESALAKAAGRKTLHWKTAARKTSRLAQSVKKAALAAKAK